MTHNLTHFWASWQADPPSVDAQRLPLRVGDRLHEINPGAERHHLRALPRLSTQAISVWSEAGQVDHELPVLFGRWRPPVSSRNLPRSGLNLFLSSRARRAVPNITLRIARCA